MGFFAKHFILSRASLSSSTTTTKIPNKSETPKKPNNHRSALTSARIFLAVSSALNVRKPELPPPDEPEEDINWGTRLYIREKHFSPGLTAEDSAARIKQTAETMKGIRDMLERMSWRYVLFYVRLKSAYLDTDLKTAMAIVEEGRRDNYLIAANKLVDDMSEFDQFLQSPKVHEPYVYYEQSLESLDEVISFLA